MANRRDVEFTYSLTDRMIRLSLGEMPDFSGAKFDGDFSLGLEQAQRRKHEYVAEQVGSGRGDACSTSAVAGARCSRIPAHAAGRRRGDVVLGAAGRVPPARARGPPPGCAGGGPGALRTFDAVASLGAFEHFCSPEDYEAGRQEEIYRDLFARVSSLLPPGGRFYLQTMVFGRNMIPASRLDMEALRAVPPRDSDEWYIALLGRQFPGPGCRSAPNR